MPECTWTKNVHGDIRHLENILNLSNSKPLVHGDIRHLEKRQSITNLAGMVHGDIRHLEIKTLEFDLY